MCIGFGKLVGLASVFCVSLCASWDGVAFFRQALKTKNNSVINGWRFDLANCCIEFVWPATNVHYIITALLLLSHPTLSCSALFHSGCCAEGIIQRTLLISLACSRRCERNLTLTLCYNRPNTLKNVWHVVTVAYSPLSVLQWLLFVLHVLLCLLSVMEENSFVWQN